MRTDRYLGIEQKEAVDLGRNACAYARSHDQPCIYVYMRILGNVGTYEH